MELCSFIVGVASKVREQNQVTNLLSRVLSSKISV